MKPFKTLDAGACPIDRENIDTDQLIPARFMSRSRAAGYGDYLFRDLRFDADGGKQDFILDHVRYAGAKTLVARRNFGTGSSREAAVYALADFGIRCVIAPSFGDIFASNAVKNGLLPAQVSENDAALLIASLESASDPRLGVDLEKQQITSAAVVVAFAIDETRRLQLLNGWDDLDLTMRHRQAIASHRTRLIDDTPWVFPDIPA